MRLSRVLLLVACGGVLMACRYNDRNDVTLPPSTHMHEFMESETFKGFFYDVVGQKLTVQYRNGDESAHYFVPLTVARGFAKNGGHAGFYQESIAPFYPQDPADLTVDGAVFQPLESASLKGARYDANTRKLHILDNNKSIRTFKNVRLKTFEGLLEAPVPAAYVSGFVSNIYEEELAARATPPEADAVFAAESEGVEVTPATVIQPVLEPGIESAAPAVPDEEPVPAPEDLTAENLMAEEAAVSEEPAVEIEEFTQEVEDASAVEEAAPTADSFEDSFDDLFAE